MKFPVIFATIIACTLGAAAPALSKNLECSIKANSASKGWITDKIWIFHEDGSDAFKVIDGVINHYNKGSALDGKINVDNAKRTTFVWNLKSTDISRQSFTMQYRLTAQKKNGAVNLTAQALGYKGPYTARGKCVQQKPKG